MIIPSSTIGAPIPDADRFGQHVTVASANGPLRCRMWGENNNDVVLLVHGATANQHWWDHIAPELAMRRTVVTIDLTGHGDARHHDHYSHDSWAAEVVEIATAISPDGPLTLVGHSMGGAVCLLAAQSAPSRFRQVIVIDAMIRDVPPEETAARRERASRHHRRYATKDEALGRFRTLPPSRRAQKHLLRHVAERSIEQGPEGWTWKFDLRVLGLGSVSLDDLRPTRVPTVLIRGDDGLVDADMER
ncbi:alpha/beta fold hydrolase, partial [Microbacterium sp. A84]|uniref:alpha/beta fold hydrolase n=1 Tax=Microbacterium sp. A84 TaxID=3450715 RepID=UPI003F42A754